MANEVRFEVKIRKIRRVIKTWSICVDLIVQELSFQMNTFLNEGIILVTRSQLLIKWENVSQPVLRSKAAQMNCDVEDNAAQIFM